MVKTYEYYCECGHHEKLTEAEAYKAGSQTRCKGCHEMATVYIHFHLPGEYNDNY